MGFLKEVYYTQCTLSEAQLLHYSDRLLAVKIKVRQEKLMISSG